MSDDPLDRMARLLAARADIDRQLRDLLPTIQAAVSAPPPVQVLAAVADMYGITVADLTGPGRSQRLASARKVAWWVLRRHGLSLPKIGAATGRDHTTVMYGLRQIERDRALLAIAQSVHGEVAA